MTDVPVAPRSLGSIIRTWAAAEPDAPMILFGEETVTWQAMYDSSRRVASALAAERVAPQEHVGFLDKNGVEYFEVLFGGSLLNTIMVAVNWRLAPPEIEYTVNDAEVKVLVVGAEFFEAIEQIESNLTTVTKIVAMGEHPRWESYDDWLARHEPVDPEVPSAWDDVSVQLYTSGTTGLPKGVMLMNSNLFTLFPAVSETWRLTEPDCVNLVCMPLFHIGGGGWAIAGMYNGCVSVVVREFVPDRVLDLMIDRRVTTALFVPAMLGFLAMVPGAADREYPLRTVVYGASPITDETLIAALRTLKCEFIQVFGMTETCGAVTSLEPDEHDPNGPRTHLLRSTGRPRPGVDMRIAAFEDPEKDCPPGVVGELWLRSPQIMKGYWGKPEATAAAVTPDGWLKTGDAGYADEEGYLFLTDRVKDMIVSGGENVYPAEVENALAGHPAIAEVAVIGVPSERWGETVKAVVVLRPGTTATAAEIISFSKQRVAGFKCPTSVDFVEVMPRNPSGKVLKKDLREPYWVGRARRIN